MKYKEKIRAEVRNFQEEAEKRLGTFNELVRFGNQHPSEKQINRWKKFRETKTENPKTVEVARSRVFDKYWAYKESGLEDCAEKLRSVLYEKESEENKYVRVLENFKQLMRVYEEFFNNRLETRAVLNGYLNENDPNFKKRIGERSWDRIIQTWYAGTNSKWGLVHKMKVENAARLFVAGKHLGLESTFNINEITTKQSNRKAYGFARKILNKDKSVSAYFETKEEVLEICWSGLLGRY